MNTNDSTTDGSGTRVARNDVIDIINEVEERVLSEDKHGATREMVAEGTCERIRERIFQLEKDVPGYRPISEFDDLRCQRCKREIDTDEMDNPDALVSDPIVVHEECL